MFRNHYYNPNGHVISARFECVMRRYVMSLAAAVSMLLPNMGRAIELIDDNLIMTNDESRSLKAAIVFGIVKTDPSLRAAYLADPVGALQKLGPILGFTQDERAILALRTTLNTITLNELIGPFIGNSSFEGTLTSSISGDIGPLAGYIGSILMPTPEGWGPPPPWWPPHWPWPPWAPVAYMFENEPWVLEYLINMYGATPDSILKYFGRLAISYPEVIGEFGTWIEFTNYLREIVENPVDAYTVVMPMEVLRNYDWCSAVWRISINPALHDAVSGMALDPIQASVIFGTPGDDFDFFYYAMSMVVLPAADILINQDFADGFQWDEGSAFNNTLPALKMAAGIAGVTLNLQ